MKRVNLRNLLSFKDAAEVLEIGVDGLYVQSVKHPSWYVKRLGVPYVDVIQYQRQRVLTRRCYESNTSILYWMMKELFITDTAISKWMAKRSSIYNGISSWSTFISTMFATPLENGVELRRTMQSEFFKVSYITIKIAIDKGVEFET